MSETSIAAAQKGCSSGTNHNDQITVYPKQFIRRKCCIRKCDGNSNNSSLFTFPKLRNEAEEDRCKVWVQNLADHDVSSCDLGQLHGNFFVCKNHFNDDQFSQKKWNVLKRNAVPMIVKSTSVESPQVFVDSQETCCVKNCSGNINISPMFTFPKTTSLVGGIEILNEARVERCDLWVSNIGDATLMCSDLSKLHNKKFLCKDHFDDSQFLDQSKQNIKNNAIPTIFHKNQASISFHEKAAGNSSGKDSDNDEQFSNKCKRRKLNDTNLQPVSAQVNPSASYNNCGPDQNTASTSLFNYNTASDVFCDSHVLESTQGTKLVKHRIKKRCCIKTCKGNSTNSSMFTFPKVKTLVNGVQVLNEEQVERCKQWLKNVGNHALLCSDMTELHRKVFLCKSHFEEHDFTNETKNRLKPKAVPTVFISSVEPFPICTMNNQGDAEKINAFKTGINDRDNEATASTTKKNKKTSLQRNKCCSPNCMNNNQTKLFRFPFLGKRANNGSFCPDESTFERFKIWVKRSGNPKLLIMHPSDVHSRFYLCSVHFGSDQFISPNTLKKNAIPSVFFKGPISDWKFNEYEQKLQIITGVERDQTEKDPFSEQSEAICAFNFEEHMISLHWVVCKTCKEKHLKSGSETSPHCKHGKRGKDFTEWNNMDPGPVPEELQDLSFIEEQLISRVHPLIAVFKLKGLQYGYSGNVINFPQAVEEFAKELPRSVSDLTSVITIRFQNDKIDPREFRVRVAKIRNALEWLQKHNPFYEDIILSEDNLKKLPQDGNVYDDVASFMVPENSYTSLNTEDLQPEVNYSTVPVTLTPGQDEQIKSHLDWPAIGKTPVNEFKTAGYIACAFPTLFPNGTADLRSPRYTTVTPASYFKHLMHYHDDRFNKHRTFRFFALNSLMRWTALTDGKIFVEKNKDFENMTVEELKKVLEKKPGFIKKIMFHGTNLRSTRVYWYQRYGELKDMCEQMEKLPTIFVTLSDADLHWPDLFRLLTDEKPENLTENDRRRLLQEKPMICDQFFDERVKAFIKHVLEKKYKVTDYWYRIEFQHRGSPHLHGVFYLDGAPDVTNIDSMSENEKQQVLDYFDELVSAINPDPQCERSDIHPCRVRFQDVENPDVDRAQLLRTVQRHTKCSKDYCLRLNKKTKKTECRFKFPIEVTDHSYLKTSDSGNIEFCPKRNDPWLNKCNLFMLQTWRANIDVTPVFSKEVLTMYLAKYISKSEPRSKGLEELFTTLMQATDDTDFCKKLIQKYFIKTCGERDFSAQEVCHILMGLKLFCAGGRRFTTLYLPSINEWIPVIEGPINESENRISSGKSLIDRYKTRPPHLDNQTLWSAAKHYDTLTWRPLKKSSIVRVFPKYQLTDNEDLNENYYQQMVILHTSWRESYSQETTWKQLYVDLNVAQSVGQQFKELHVEDVEDDEFENDTEDNLNCIREEEWMVAAQLGPQNSIPEIEIGRREIDLQHSWSSNNKHYQQYGSLTDLQQFILLNKNAELAMNHSSSEVQNVTLNKEQQEVIHLLQKQLSTIPGINSDRRKVPKRTIVQGKAGTGKSVLIKEMTRLIDTHLGHEAYLLVASTGIAALNIHGKTVHSVFHIPKDISSFSDLKGERARDFSNLMSKVKFIIIDEYSMIGSNLLAMIDKRCRQGTGVLDEDFGGIYIYMFGDIRQLPPVKDVALYNCNQKSELSQHGKIIFDNFQVTIFLHQCVRQQDPRFLQILDNISIGELSQEDYNFLATRFTTVPTISKEGFEDCLHLFSTRAEVAEHNHSILSNLKDEVNGKPSPVARIPAEHNCKTAERGTTEDADGLTSVLYLAKNARVMLLHNLWTKCGLVNGSQGKIINILYDDDHSPPDDLPVVILCSFQSYNGPALLPDKKVVPLYPVVAKWTSKSGINCIRKQYPLALAYSCSIHKSQGMTLEKVVIDIGKKEFSLGLTYVALSRVKTMEGLFLAPFDYPRISRLKTLPSMLGRLKFEEQLKAKRYTYNTTTLLL